MTTETQPLPTDAELDTLLPMVQLNGEKPAQMVWLTRKDARAFSRAVLAKWGQPAQAAEPVAWYEYNGDLDAWFLAYSHNPKAKTRPLVFGDTAPQPSTAAQGDAIEHELAMLIRRIVSSARRNCEDGSNVLKLANEAWAYLVRKGLNGSPLRDAGIESDPTPPAKAADSVQEDAARLDWLDQQHEAYGFQDIHEGNRWEISGAYANVRKAIDAARKQGANHDNA